MTIKLHSAIISKVDVRRYIIAIAIFGIIFWIFNAITLRSSEDVLDLTNIEKIVLEKDAELSRSRNTNCSYYDCFNVYKCGHKDITIYIYPIKEFSDLKSTTSLTKEFYEILNIIRKSPYYTTDPTKACIFVPSIDTLNQNRIDVNLVGKALASLD